MRGGGGRLLDEAGGGWVKKVSQKTWGKDIIDNRESRLTTVRKLGGGMKRDKNNMRDRKYDER